MEVQTLKHSKLGCNYRVVFIPEVPQEGDSQSAEAGVVSGNQELARRKECKILEGDIMADHVHMMAMILPNYAVAQVIGYIKGPACQLSAIQSSYGIT